MRNGNNIFVWMLYKTVPGRFTLRLIQRLHLDRVMIRFLESSWSRPLVNWYISHYKIELTKEQVKSYRSFRDIFARKRSHVEIDQTPGHLISPCDGWLRIYPIQKDSTFEIKGSLYQVKDFIQDEALARNYEGGTQCHLLKFYPVI